MTFILYLLLGASHISVTPSVIDSGIVEEGKIIEYSFKIENTGDSTLTIDKVRTTCGCTTASLSKDTLLSGEKAELVVLLNTKGYVQWVEKPVYIYSSDDENPVLKRMVKAFVQETRQPELDMELDRLEIGDVFYGEEKTLTLWIKNTGELDLIILETVLPQGIQLKTELPYSIKHDEKKPLIFIFSTEELDTGIYNEEIILKTNIRRKYRYEIPVVANIRETGIMLFSPFILSFDEEKDSIFIQNTGNKEFFLLLDKERITVDSGETRSLLIPEKKIEDGRIRIILDVPIEKTCDKKEKK